MLALPSGVAVDSAGDLYIADNNNGLVDKVTPAGALSIVAGARGGFGGLPTPGPATDSDMYDASGVAVDGSGNLYIADMGNDVVEKVTPAGVLSIVAGVPGHGGSPTPGPATTSDLNSPAGVAVDSAGNLYIADYRNYVVEKVTPAGVLSIVAGVPGQWGLPTPGPAASSDLAAVDGVAVDSAGNLYIADRGNNVIEKVTPAGVLSIVAGVPGHGGAPTPGPATSSDLAVPFGVAVDGAGNLYIADDAVVEKVTPAGALSIVAGVPGRSGLPTIGPATSSDLDQADGVAADSAGNVYIADSLNEVVEKVVSP